jgi:hypothetical protein
MKTLSPVEAAQVKSTLALARSGRATLVQLALAHELASGSGLNGTLGELREHMRRMISPPPLHESSKHIVLGVISGIITHYALP